MMWGALNAEGWLELLPLRLMTLAQAGLPPESRDREVWRCAQANKLILLTSNRRMREADALEQTIREENVAAASGFDDWQCQADGGADLPGTMCHAAA